jgi:hypothetical protein
VPAPSNEAFVALLQANGQRERAQFFRYPIKLKASKWMWQAICDKKPPTNKQERTLYAALMADATGVVSMTAERLKLPKLPQRKGDAAVEEVLREWESSVTLWIVIRVEPEQGHLQVITDNVELGLQRLAMCRPVGKMLQMTLKVDPKARKASFSKDGYKVTVTVPADTVVVPGDLGVKPLR